MSNLAKQHIAIPANRSVLLMDTTVTAVGKETLRVSLEQESAILTVHVSSMAVGTAILVDVYEVSQDSGDEFRIYTQSPIRAAGDPIQFPVTPGGSFRVQVEHTGAATYTVRGKSVSSIPASLVPETEADRVAKKSEEVFRQELLSCLDNINDVMKRILNHQRVITGIESDEGEEF